MSREAWFAVYCCGVSCGLVLSWLWRLWARSGDLDDAARAARMRARWSNYLAESQERARQINSVTRKHGKGERL